MKKLQEIELYRITHIDNTLHILNNGITHRNSKNADPDYKSIGDLSLIQTRQNKEVRITSGIYDFQNAPVVILGDFIPFYFGVKMPMLFVIQNGGNFVEEAVSPENIIYLVCDLMSLVSLKQEYYFSDGHATDRLTTFYDSSKINRLTHIIDWEAINSIYWGGIENLEVKRKKQAEFLIKGDIPSRCIKRIICFNNNAKEKILKFGIKETMIEINKNAYY